MEYLCCGEAAVCVCCIHTVNNLKKDRKILYLNSWRHFCVFSKCRESHINVVGRIGYMSPHGIDPKNRKRKTVFFYGPKNGGYSSLNVASILLPAHTVQLSMGFGAEKWKSKRHAVIGQPRYPRTLWLFESAVDKQRTNENSDYLLYVARKSSHTNTHKKQ